MTLATAALILVVGGAVSRAVRGDRRLHRLRLVRAAVLLAVATVVALAVRLANDGVVPATVDARRTAGHATVEPDGDPVPAIAHRRLLVLGDVLAWPSPLPLADEMGLADVLALVAIGLVVLPRRRTDEREPATVEVSEGRLWCEAPTAGGQPIEVVLPHGRVASGRGRFGVVVGPRGTAVVVVAGGARVTSGATVVPIGAGEGVAVRPDGTVGQPRRLPEAELTGDPWIAERLQAPPPAAPPVEPLWRRPPSIVATGSALVLVLVVALTYLAQVATVPSGSMEPTLGPGDRVLVAKTGGTPRSGDVVAFERPAGVEAELLLVKRVVAEGGQTVEVRDGRVWVDGRPRDEPYLPAGAETTEVCGPRGVVEVPVGSLFVLGDARADSTDSRCFGPVPTSAVVGSVVARAWPPGGL